MKRFGAASAAMVLVLSIAACAGVRQGAVQQLTDQPGGVSFDFLPDEGGPLQTTPFDLQYYYMQTTQAGICLDHHTPEAVIYERAKAFGKDFRGDSYESGGHRSIVVGSGTIYIRATSRAPTSFASRSCENGAQFSPVAGHAYEVLQKSASEDGRLRTCSLSIVDKTTHEPLKDFIAIRFCK